MDTLKFTIQIPHCFVAQFFAGKVALRAPVAQNATKKGVGGTPFILHRHHSSSILTPK